MKKVASLPTPPLRVLLYSHTCCPHTHVTRRRWGKNLTQMQMIQFVLMNAQAIYILAVRCPYPNQLTAFYLVYIISLFALFMQFYLQRWTPKAAEGKKKA